MKHTIALACITLALALAACGETPEERADRFAAAYEDTQEALDSTRGQYDRLRSCIGNLQTWQLSNGQGFVFQADLEQCL